MRINSRAYRDESDYRRVRGFLVETFGLNRTHHNWCIERWDYWRHTGDVRAGLTGDREWAEDVRLWETEEGELVGVVNREDSGIAFLQIHPDYRHLEREMVCWAEEQLVTPSEDGTSRNLGFWVYDYDTERRAIMKHRGYADHLVGHKRRRTLDQPLPEVETPEGYAVRALLPGDDLGLRCTVFTEAFGCPEMETDVYRFLQTAPGYRQDLDIVAVAPDGTFASFCLTWFDDVNRIGMLEPVGTHPDHQRRGLGRVVVREGLRRLATLGATVAYVGCADSTPADCLYQSVGFADSDVERLWQKTF